jgi:hypothetical protein
VLWKCSFAELTTNSNDLRLKELILNGPHPPPGKIGAKYIIREDGQRLDLRYVKKSSDQHLELGYKVSTVFIVTVAVMLFIISSENFFTNFVPLVCGVLRWRGTSMMEILFISIGSQVFTKCLSWGIESKLCPTQLSD